jgi:hypothetical protein
MDFYHLSVMNDTIPRNPEPLYVDPFGYTDYVPPNEMNDIYDPFPIQLKKPSSCKSVASLAIIANVHRQTNVAGSITRSSMIMTFMVIMQTRHGTIHMNLNWSNKKISLDITQLCPLTPG